VLTTMSLTAARAAISGKQQQEVGEPAKPLTVIRADDRHLQHSACYVMASWYARQWAMSPSTAVLE